MLLERAVHANENREGLIIQTRLTDGHHTILDRSTPDLSDDVAQRFRSGQSRLRQAPEGEVFLHALLPRYEWRVIGESTKS